MERYQNGNGGWGSRRSAQGVTWKTTEQENNHKKGGKRWKIKETWVGETFQVVSWFGWLRAGKAFIQPPAFSWWPVNIFTTASNPLPLCTASCLPLCPQCLVQAWKPKAPSDVSSACVLPVIKQGIRPYSPLAALQRSKMRELQSILSHEVCPCRGWNQLLLCPREWVAGVWGCWQS